MFAVFKTSRNHLNRLRQDKRGVSAIEFALVLPVLLLVYFGIVGVTQLLSVDRKVTMITSATADLVAQETVIDNAMIQDIYTASLSIIEPFNSNSVSIVVTSIVADDDNNTTVAWSHTSNGTAKTPGATITVPNGITQANTSVIFTEVAYSYNSIIGQLISGVLPTNSFGQMMSGTITLTDKFYTRPRNSSEVEFN